MYYIIIFIITFILLIFLYILAIAPNLFRRKDMSFWKNKHFAHRGLHNNTDAPENSYKAFCLAIENGYGIELDVQLTKDNIPVVFHDDNLLRVCGVNKKVNDLSLEELSQYTLKDTKEKIPTLKAVLDLVNASVPLVIEIKSNNHLMSICSLTQKLLDHYKGPYCIESFNPLVLAWYKKHKPSVIRGQLSTFLVKENDDNTKFLNFILQNLLLNFITKPDFIAYEHKYSNRLSYKICHRFYKTPTFAWTIRSEDELIQSRKHFDSFIFEYFRPKES